MPAYFETSEVRRAVVHAKPRWYGSSIGETGQTGARRNVEELDRVAGRLGPDGARSLVWEVVKDVGTIRPSARDVGHVTKVFATWAIGKTRDLYPDPTMTEGVRARLDAARTVVHLIRPVAPEAPLRGSDAISATGSALACYEACQSVLELVRGIPPQWRQEAIAIGAGDSAAVLEARLESHLRSLADTVVNGARAWDENVSDVTGRPTFHAEQQLWPVVREFATPANELSSTRGGLGVTS